MYSRVLAERLDRVQAGPKKARQEDNGLVQTLRGDRIGRQGAIKLGCSALITDADGQKVLLTRRADNGEWCLPSGGVEPGESVAEACAREVWEETGLRVEVGRLIGVYSDPNALLRYSDGHQFQLVALSFEARVVAGELGLSDETTAYGYYSREEMDSLPMLELHRQRIADALAGQTEPFVR